MICLSGYFTVGGETRVRGESVDDTEMNEEVEETHVGGVSGAPPRQHHIYHIVRFLDYQSFNRIHSPEEG
jgi:hypothetical protein